MTTQRRPCSTCSRAARARWKRSAAVELALGPARASHLAGKKVGERGKGKTLGLGMTGDASDGQSGLGGEPQALVREPGLAEARAAADEDAARRGSRNAAAIVSISSDRPRSGHDGA